jgi:hypothetical protein
MADLVYLLCAATSLVCAGLLFRSHAHTRARLLFWSSLCFAGLAMNNVLLFVEAVLLPETSFGLVRSAFALAGIGLLIIGLVWEAP